VRHHSIYITKFFNKVTKEVTGIPQHLQASGLSTIYNSLKDFMFDLGTNIFIKYDQKL
jgi:hypothetical protein